MSVLVQCLRTTQALCAFVILGLTAYVTNWYDTETSIEPPPQVRWMLAASAITVFSVLYLEAAPRYMANTFHPVGGFALEIFNSLVHFAAFVAFSVFMNQLLYCRGSVCGAAKAAIAFSAIEFLLWGITAAFAAKVAFKGGLNIRIPRLGRPAAPVRSAKEMELESDA